MRRFGKEWEEWDARQLRVEFGDGTMMSQKLIDLSVWADDNLSALGKGDGGE